VNLFNSNEPEPQGLPESEIADMEGYLSEIAVLLPVLGFDVLRPAAQATRRETLKESEQQPTLTFTNAGENAQAKEVAGAFVVLAGSLARLDETPTCPRHASNLRKRLIADGALVSEPGGAGYRFDRDVAFDTPSGAAAVVCGGSVNGHVYWRDTRTGINYGELRARKLGAEQTAEDLQ
jgi:hypothetical protein